MVHNPKIMLPDLKFCELKTNELMSLHTNFKIGGVCDFFVIPKTIEGIKSVINYVEQNEIPLLVIGNGTNLLFPDDKFPGVVMQIGESYFHEVKVINESFLQVESGTSISKLLEIATDKGLSGLEFMSGIPGTLGGAITMNAGAQRKRIGEIIERVKVINTKGEIYWIGQTDIRFGYRESRFKCSTGVYLPQKEFEIILEAEIKIKKNDSSKIKTRIQEITKSRESSLPLEFPSAGCVFKNTQDKLAGKLIELTGCKGLRVGDAQVSTQHANFIINVGKATYKDVRTLISKVQQKVYQKFKVSLETELIIINDTLYK